MIKMPDRTLLVHVAAGRRGPHLAAGIDGLTDVLSGPLADLAVQNLRVRPRQVRSIKSVERILSVAAEMILRRKGAKAIRIEKIATAAGVTPQAAYRYFKDADELIKTVLRCIVIREHERVISLLSHGPSVSETEMAEMVVGAILETCEHVYDLPEYIRDAVLHEYRQVGHDASLLVSKSIPTCIDHVDGCRSLDVIKASVAIVATIAVATSSFARKTAPLRGSRLEDTLTSLFVSVLQSGGDSADAFREADSEFPFS